MPTSYMSGKARAQRTVTVFGSLNTAPHSLPM